MNPITQNQQATDLVDAGEDFARYAQNILKSVQEGLERSNIDPIESLAIMIELSDVASIEELEMRVAELKDKYPVLDEAQFREQVHTEESLDEIVQKYVSHLIKTGKVKEADTFAKAADAKDATVEALQETFPDFANYINQA